LSIVADCGESPTAIVNPNQQSQSSMRQSQSSTVNQKIGHRPSALGNDER